MIQHVYGEKKGKQMIKLIATDIDGTLVADGTLDLNPEYYDVIKELKRRGTIVLAVKRTSESKYRESIHAST